MAAIDEWVNTTCPVCGRPAKRETNTMPQWAGSSWYFLRYVDNKNDKELVNREIADKYLPVDMYIGGVEHAVLHLLYSRFYTKFLHDIGVVDFDEPFTKLFNQGMINGKNGIKMSKSKGNVVSPDDLVKNYADRLYGYSPSDRLFETTKHYLKNEMDRGCRKTGLKEIRVHDLRHSHASLLIELGFAPLLISERLGHESVTTTLEIYSHLYPTKQGEVASRLQDFA